MPSLRLKHVTLSLPQAGSLLRILKAALFLSRGALPKAFLSTLNSHPISFLAYHQLRLSE